MIDYRWYREAAKREKAYAFVCPGCGDKRVITAVTKYTKTWAVGPGDMHHETRWAVCSDACLIRLEYAPYGGNDA